MHSFEFFLPALLLPILFACSSQTHEPAPPPTPAPAPEPVVTHPGPSPQEIKQAVESRGPQLQECHTVGSFEDSQLVGTVTVNFTIEPDGTVSDASDAGSDMPVPEVIDCVLGVFADLRFRPGGAGSMDVTYPVRFGS